VLDRLTGDSDAHRVARRFLSVRIGFVLVLDPQIAASGFCRFS
jgi:hypothetical protein